MVHILIEKRRKAKAQYQQEYRRRQKLKKREAEESRSEDWHRTSHSNYKRTTDKQYSLLTQEMIKFRAENRFNKSTDAIIYWNSLTDKLNDLGPPYRTVQQWKKVWIDFISFHSKRNFKSVPKFTKSIKTDLNTCDIFRVEGQDDNNKTTTTTTSKDAEYLRFECDENFQSMCSIKSNHCIDECSRTDTQSSQQLTPQLLEPLIEDEYSYDSRPNLPPNLEQRTPRRSKNQPSTSIPRSLSFLHPPNNLLLDQTLYTLQNQVENQAKFLEHIPQISSTIANLMKLQVIATEKQTEAVRRQALATEHHTLVMNNFIDLLREKMPKTNSRTPTTPL